MPSIKFGRKQVGKPIPQSISLIADFFIGFFGIVSGFLTVAKFIPQSWSDIITPILTALFIPLCIYIKKFFAVQIEPGTKIPVENVSEIKESVNEEKK